MDSKEKKDIEENKTWRDRDWVWVVVFLIFIIILLIAYIVKINNANDYLSLVSTVVSIVLSIVAIIYALVQTVISDRLNASLQNKIDNIQVKIAEVYSLKEDISKLEQELISKDVYRVLSKIKNKDKLAEEDYEQIDEFIDDIKKVGLEKKKVNYDSVFNFMDE